MAVRLRLMRLGRKGQPFYRIVAVDSRKKRDGAYIEKIGHYNPLRRPAEVVIDDKKALKWLQRGAIPSDSVRNLFSRRGVMMAFDLQKTGAKEEEIWDRVARFRLDKEEKLKAREAAAIAEHAKKIAAKAAAPAEAVEEPETKAAEEAVEEAAAEAETEEEAAAEAEAAPAEKKKPEKKAAPAEKAEAETKEEAVEEAEAAPAEEERPEKAAAPAAAESPEEPIEEKKEKKDTKPDDSKKE